MLNQVILIGRLVQEPQLNETNDGKLVSTIRLAVQRPFKNSETNDYEVDFINCTLWQGTAENTTKHAEKGSVLAIKGRLIERQRTIDDDKKIMVQEVVAERVTFIATPNSNR